MSNSTTSTNTPYAGVKTSSAPTQPYNYISESAPVSSHSSESVFTTKEVLIFGGGVVFTAVVTYFSTLISVNSDISSNRENISVIKSDIAHLRSVVEKAEGDIEKNEIGASKLGILEVKVTGLEKQLDAHIGSTNDNNDIKK